MGYYYWRDGSLSMLELIGLPIMLGLAWWFGKQYDIARFYSEKDALTGVYNRRFVDTYFEKHAHQMFVLLLLDVNDFKLINDHYGHEAGDRFLQTIADELAKCVGPKDLVARWGGDEFLILIQTTGQAHQEKALTETINRIQQNLKNTSPENLEITTSIGSAHYPKQGTTLDQLLRIADKQMYHNKSRRKLKSQWRPGLCRKSHRDAPEFVEHKKEAEHSASFCVYTNNYL